MQLFIIKDLLVVVDSYEGLFKRKIRAEIVFVLFFFSRQKQNVVVKQVGEGFLFVTFWQVSGG